MKHLSIVVFVLLLILTRCGDEETDVLPPTATILLPADQAVVNVPRMLNVQPMLEDDFNLSNYTIYVKKRFPNLRLSDFQWYGHRL